MDSEKTNYIKYLSSFLQNINLRYIIENFDNNSDDILLVIKEGCSYKCSTDEEKSQCIEEKFKKCLNSFYCLTNYRLKDKFKKIIFVCIFTKNTRNYEKLISNLPKADSCIFNTFFWSSERNIVSTLFIQDVKNLLSTVYIKPAKRN
jgi:hypothetical protein